MSDADAVFEYGRDPEVTRYMDWPTHVEIWTVREFLQVCPARWASGEEFSWVLTVKPSDRALGSIGCRIRGHAVDFGYVLHRSHWRQGLVPEAARAIVGWASGLEAVHRVWATCDTENLASARVLEKAGLTREGLLRRWAVRPNLGPEPRDAFIYSKVR